MKRLVLASVICSTAVFASGNVDYIAGSQDDVVEPSGGNDANYVDYDKMVWSSTVVIGPISGRSGGSSASSGKVKFGISSAAGYHGLYGYGIQPNLGFDPMKKYMGGDISLGMGLLYALSEKFYLNSGLELDFRSGFTKYEGSVTKDQYVYKPYYNGYYTQTVPQYELVTTTFSGNVEMRIMSLAIPAMFRAVRESFYVEGGFTLSFRIWSNGTENMDHVSNTDYIYHHQEFNYDDIFGPMDFAFNVGLGFAIGSNKDLGLRMGFGLIRQGDAEEYSPKNLTAQLRFNYWI